MLRMIRAKLGLTLIDHVFCDSVRKIPWFSRCGQQQEFDIPLPAQPIRAWDEAIASMYSGHWHNTAIEASNALSVFLHNHFNRRYQLWNAIADEAKREVVEPIADQIWRPFAESRRLEDAFVHSLQWTVLAALMEHEYRSCAGAPKFFLYLLEVYRRGQIPCGWAGSWPNGKLLVH